jgi:hypothetical protein
MASIDVEQVLDALRAELIRANADVTHKRGILANPYARPEDFVAFNRASGIAHGVARSIEAVQALAGQPTGNRLNN